MISKFNDAFFRLRKEHEYLNRERDNYDFHRLILKLLEKGHEPVDLDTLLLQWPHRSTVSNDPTKMAYTRSIEHGKADRQTVTTIGRYIKQHFPSLKDHEIRDLVGLTQAGESCSIINTTDEMVNAAERGPHSCMSTDFESDEHTYVVYAPELGWSMAIRTVDFDDEKRIDGRALIYTYKKSVDSDAIRIFVRSYKRNLEDEDGYSYADEMLEAWMKEQGIKKVDEWPEHHTRMKYIESTNRWGEKRFIAPYIDGAIQSVSINPTLGYFEVDRNGDHECDSTEGWAYPAQNECEDCGDGMEGEGNEVGYYSGHVCSYCYDDNYVEARGRRGLFWMLNRDEVVEVDGDYYDRDELDRYGIVELPYERDNGDMYALKDDCVKDYSGDYLLEADAVEITYGSYQGEYIHEDSAIIRPEGVFFDAEEYQEYLKQMELELELAE